MNLWLLGCSALLACEIGTPSACYKAESNRDILLRDLEHCQTPQCSDYVLGMQHAYDKACQESKVTK
jgi:hypothetical protein